LHPAIYFIGKRELLRTAKNKEVPWLIHVDPFRRSSRWHFTANPSGDPTNLMGP
jgi:hypothetical protein